MTSTVLASVLAVAIAACGRPASGADDPPGPPPTPHLERRPLVRYHMQRRFDDLLTIQKLLIAGKLEDAKTLAYFLTQSSKDPGMVPWDADAAQVTLAARAVVAAPGIDEALRREARLAARCAECHLHTQKVPIFPAAPVVPSDAATPEARMARHQWAVDRLWEGMVGGIDRPWRSGVEVLAATPLPFSPLDDAPSLASHLQELARNALASGTIDSLDDRATTYGEMLVTCAACHAERAPARKR